MSEFGSYCETWFFWGLWINLLVRSQNGQKLVPNAWRVWSHTFIIQVNTGNIVMWETQHNIADFDLFKTLILRETLKTQNQHQERSCVFSEVTRWCQKVGCARNRLQFHTVLQKLKSHLSMQVYAWTVFPLSLFGIWWLKYFVPSRTKQKDPRESYGETCQQSSSQPCMTPPQSKHFNVIPTNIDHCPPNSENSDSSAMLYVFEDNEAVTKMIIKCRSYTMRHVSRTHRVVLDWLFDRINLDPKIQIRCIETKHQLADMLTKGNFKRDEWNNLLHLFNISHLSSTCCIKNFSLISCSTMAKRIQNQKEEERVVSMSRPAVMNTSSYFIATSSSAASSPIASKSSGMPIASGNPIAGWVLNQAHSTQRRRLKCGSRMHTLAG